MRGEFPGVLLIYFNNVPYLDEEALETLKQITKSAKENNVIIMITGINGRLLDILKEKADSEKNNDAMDSKNACFVAINKLILENRYSFVVSYYIVWNNKIFLFLVSII